MTLILFLITALVSLSGGFIILARSGEEYGRTVALGIIFIALNQFCYFLFSIFNIVGVLPFASFFELSGTAAFILSVITMQPQMKNARQTISWLKRSLFIVCAGYGIVLLVFPSYHHSLNSEGFLMVGRLWEFQSAMMVIGSIAFIWIMENILRSSKDSQKRVLKYPALGCIAVGAALFLGSIYRLSTHSIAPDVLFLCSLMLLAGISFLIFFSIRFKLFEMDIFVSRYIVYHSITFISIGAYLLVTGIIILGIRELGIRPSFVTTGFFVFLALLTLSFIVVSPDTRARLRFFINTHFFSNKYDYRKEWGELSGYLSIAFNENQIIHVTAQVILDSMYISELSLWLLENNMYRRAFSFPSLLKNKTIASDMPFIGYLEKKPYFLRKTPCTRDDILWDSIVRKQKKFLDKIRIELAVPMLAENRMIGFIAVGKENPGTPYGQDDIDLLSAIATQSSAALMSARFGKQLAENKELDTFNRMSAYVLHDLKNAAGNLSLMLQNAPKYMDQKEFQDDMIETIKQALARIDKVMGRLGAIPEKEELKMRNIHLISHVDSLISKLQPRLKDISVCINIDKELRMITDEDLLEKVLENIIVNATEAVSVNGRITIDAGTEDDSIYISIKDNGHGMSEDFIRERLFKPFQTTKKKGSGLGLWQVKTMLDQIGAIIEHENSPAQGMSFKIIFPGRASDKKAKAGEGHEY